METQLKRSWLHRLRPRLCCRNECAVQRSAAQDALKAMDGHISVRHPRLDQGSRYGVVQYPIGSMYAIYANIWGILMVNFTMLPYIAYMDPMGMDQNGTLPLRYFKDRKACLLCIRRREILQPRTVLQNTSRYIGAQLQELLSKIVLLVKMEAAAQCCAAVESFGYGMIWHLQAPGLCSS